MDIDVSKFKPEGVPEEDWKDFIAISASDPAIKQIINDWLMQGEDVATLLARVAIAHGAERQRLQRSLTNG